MSEIDDIKARLDIVDVINAYTPLKKAGRSYKGLCPFHTEKTPSFVVFPDNQTWRCFGACGEGGDVFSFVMKADRLDFTEAMQVLAKRVGVELKPRTPQSQQHEEINERLTGLLTQAAEFYHELLNKLPEADIARRYVVINRDLNPDTLKTFQIGFAPEAWQVTYEHFTKLGYTAEDMLHAGLVVRNDQGRIYDRFRYRLMIPIHDPRGRVVGFGARALTDDQNPKYLNSPQGELFDKSKLLYGLHLARRAIRETETVVVVEGYMDAITAHQAGYQNVVAQMGTALTTTQVQLLAKYARSLVLALDSDNAGVRATMRGLNVVHESLVEGGHETQVTFDALGMISLSGQLKLDTRILSLPQGKDPDDFIRARRDEWQTAVDNSTPLADYVIEVSTRGISKQTSIVEREDIAQGLLPLLTATENDLQRNQNIQKLAMRLHIPERDLLSWAQKGKTSVRPSQQPQRQSERKYNNQGRGDTANTGSHSEGKPVEAQVKHRELGLERYCLSILLREPLWIFAAERKFRQLALLAGNDNWAITALEPFGVSDFTQGEYQALFRIIRDASEQNALEPQDYIQQNLSPEMRELVDLVLPEPLEQFHERVSEMHRRALRGVLRDNRQADGENVLETKEFLFCVLDIRLRRIEREAGEVRFLLEDLQQNDPTADVMMHDYSLMIKGFARAKTLIQKSHRDLRG